MDTIYWILGAVLTIGVGTVALIGVVIYRACKQKNKNYCIMQAYWKEHHHK